jgi:hypothetical protein
VRAGCRQRGSAGARPTIEAGRYRKVDGDGIVEPESDHFKRPRCPKVAACPTYLIRPVMSSSGLEHTKLFTIIQGGANRRAALDVAKFEQVA